MADEVDPANLTASTSSKPEISTSSKPEILQRDNARLESTLPDIEIVGNIPEQANSARGDIAPVVADQVLDFHPGPGNSNAAIEQSGEPAPPSAPQLAIADWRYSLPDQAPDTFADSLPSSVKAHPVVLAPVKSALAQGRRRANSKNTVAVGAEANHFTGQTGNAPGSVGTGGISGAGFAAAKQGDDKYRLVGSSIEFQMPVAANGVPAGNLTLHVAPDQEISLQLKELISLLHDRFDPQVLQTLNASQAIHAFVSFGQLRASGIDIRYDAARDRLTLAVDQP